MYPCNIYLSSSTASWKSSKIAYSSWNKTIERRNENFRSALNWFILKLIVKELLVNRSAIVSSVPYMQKGFISRHKKECHTVKMAPNRKRSIVLPPSLVSPSLPRWDSKFRFSYKESVGKKWINQKPFIKMLHRGAQFRGFIHGYVSMFENVEHVYVYVLNIAAIRDTLLSPLRG